jgi:hypothetical protein
MQYDDFDNEETPIVVAPPRRELLVEFLKVLTGGWPTFVGTIITEDASSFAVFER